MTCFVLALFAAEALLGAEDLRVGAARVEITPAADAALPMSGYAGRKDGHRSVHDPLYVRAVVLEAGARRAAIVSADLIGFSHEFWAHVAGRLAAEHRIPVSHLLLAATHTHGAPSLRDAYAQRVEDSLSAAVAQAASRLAPGRVGMGVGRANVNVNRRALQANGSWYLGINPDGPSDKTVAVVKFESAAGVPLAMFVNYGVHGTALGMRNSAITADLPGATSRWVERHFGDKVVVPWTSGAGGDQCPIYDRLDDRFDGMEAMGRILGDEVIRVAASITTTGRVSLGGAQKVVTCPGQKAVPGLTKGAPPAFVDAAATSIRLSLLRINDIALTGVSGEVLTLIGQRTKSESPTSNTIMVTHCNGSSGYLPDDAAYARVSYEIKSARVKPGCAETAIVKGLVQMIQEQTLEGRALSADK